MSLALLHYPVYDKKGQVINTSLTNLDLHDISRAAFTFGLEKFYLIQPQENQRELLDQLLLYWQTNIARKYNPYRADSLALIDPCASLEEAFFAASAQTPGQVLKVIATSARAVDNMTGYAEMRRIMGQEGGHYLLLLGTGWGLTEETLAGADFRLRPVYGVSGYNHLSVRSAASIILDRLLGEKNQ
ncbi:MAG: RNA methyltransferase [Clostridiales bacterium]|nr:RNA methyltransferase [Clostridiales bacterium]